MDTYLKVRWNVMPLSSIEDFTYMKGGFHQGQKDVYFLRIIGYSTEKEYLEKIRKSDEELNQRKKNQMGGFFRTKNLPILTQQEEIIFYTKQYEAMKKENDVGKTIKFDFINEFQKNTYKMALQQIEKLYQKLNPNTNESMLKNFVIKVMSWSDFVFPELFCSWNERVSPKFIYYGKAKKQEYLFLYFLTLLGCDVLYLNPREDIMIDKEYLNFSYLIKESQMGDIIIPEVKKEDMFQNEFSKVAMNNTVDNTINKTGEEKIRISIPQRNSQRNRGTENSRQPAPKTVSQPTPVVIPSDRKEERREWSFEELAVLASSVVMIGAFDRSGKCFKTGSGVMISKKGYILTNDHVASEGAYYCVRIEGEEQSYDTDQVIKYNTYQDLALIRIERSCKPIPIYNGKKPLVRGQKVVAIGSPLGLFNSVSDGIISGFRNFDDVSMIQFTAPISHGSSGGAVLNMYGELIGISQGGFDEGQNINLAVDYTTVLPFIRGFL
ncbi:MAG: trypsin-like serine protease [Lachnospiraceae bacterium]|jgi:serine protease Do|nr:trypsin-like serine protease [Lachnospiraceae bacterium]